MSYLNTVAADNPKELREIIAAKYDAAEAIMATAVGQNRDLNDREKAQVDTLIGNSSTGSKSEVGELERRLSEADDREARARADISGWVANDATLHAPAVPSAVAVGLDHQGTPRPQYIDQGGRPVDVLGRSDRVVDLPRFRSSPVHPTELDLGRFIVGSATGSWKKAPAEKRFLDAMQEGTNTAGGYLVPEELSATFIDAARAKSVMLSAGVQQFTMKSETMTLARLVTEPSFVGTAESAEMTESTPSFDTVQFTARKSGTYIRISNELLQDGQNVSEIVTSSLSKAWATELDRLVIRGDGGGDDGALGALNDPDINSTAVGGNVTHANLGDAWVGITGRNYEPTGMVLHPNIWADLGDIKASTAGTWLGLPPYMGNVTPFTTTGITTGNILMGDLTTIAIGIRLAVELFVSRERFLTTNETAIRLVTRFDTQRLDVNALHSLTGITAV